MFNININNFSKIENEVFTYLSAAARLYGFVLIDDLVQLYNNWNSPLSEEEFLIISQSVITAESTFLVISDRDIFTANALPIDTRVVARSLTYATWDNLFTLEAAQEDLPLCLLPEEEFLAYANAGYIPDIQENRRMLEFLKTHVQAPVDPEELLLEVLLQAEDDSSPLNCLYELQRLGAVFGDLHDRSEFVRIYQGVYDYARKPIHRGHSERELQMLDVPDALKNRRIVSWFLHETCKYYHEPSESELLAYIEPVGYTKRACFNRKAQMSCQLPPLLYDPCICGSGLRYIDCCGRR